MSQIVACSDPAASRDIPCAIVGAEQQLDMFRALVAGCGIVVAGAGIHADRMAHVQTRLSAPTGPRPVIHRLTRAEYANTIRDLLDVEIDVASLLPADESFQGFDNIGGVLSISPSLLERYLSAARRISRLAVGDVTIGPAFASRTYTAPPTLFQDSRMSDDLPFGSRGGIAIRHRFPVDGEYLLRVRLRRNILGYVRGLGDRHQLEVRLDGELLKVFDVGGKGPGTPAPVSFSGVIPGDAEWEAYGLTADAGLEIRFGARAGTRIVGVSFIDQPFEAEGPMQPPLMGLGFSYSEATSTPAEPWRPAVDSVAITGPHQVSGPGETESRKRLFTCRPAVAEDAEPCATRILSTLARRAYRRPVTAKDVDTLLEFFTTGQRRGFEEGIRTAVERVLVDPNFLLHIERDPESATIGMPYRISDLELASRLSFFLWSSIPDDAVLDLAVGNALGDPATLDRQVRRMLADERAAALVSNFAAQWLSLRQLRNVTPDPELFPEFDGNLREAFERETALFVESQLREDRSVVDLLTANYTFVNERLARHYGIPGIYGSHFRRVALTNDDRGGLLGHGGILTVTSYPTRTSPVVRGRWLLENIIGTAPPPPPPDIPPLPAATDGGRALSMRERTEQHRRNPVCASCHAQMDPLGFALENFDAIGRWRVTSEAGTPIDVSGSLRDGTQFRGVAGLRNLVKTREEEFVLKVTEKLMTYALRRALEPSDDAAIRKIVQDGSREGYRWSSLILGVTRSVLFQMRTPES